MNKQYDNNNTGVLFLNDRKEKDTHPDKKGSAEVDGKQYWVSGWDKQTSKGDTLSLSFTLKEDAKAGASKAKESANTARGNDSFDDEIGF
jgi:hypothetical protein